MEKYIAKFTEIMREADKVFETTGGGTRHYVRDVLFPIMEREGLLLTDQQAGARWVKASERLPGLKTPVKWRQGEIEMKIKPVWYMVLDTNSEYLSECEWLDESAGEKEE